MYGSHDQRICKRILRDALIDAAAPNKAYIGKGNEDFLNDKAEVVDFLIQKCRAQKAFEFDLSQVGVGAGWIHTVTIIQTKKKLFLMSENDFRNSNSKSLICF